MAELTLPRDQKKSLEDRTQATTKVTIEKRKDRRVMPAALSKRLEWMGPYRGVVGILLATMVTFSSLRVAMLIGFADWELLTFVEFCRILLTGVKFDLLVGLCFILFQTFHLTVISHNWRMRSLSRYGLEFGWLFTVIFLPLICIVEWLFFDEFESRLNYIAFEYLVYPTEVCCNIWESYPIVPLLTVVVAFGGCSFLLVRRRFLRYVAMPMSWLRRYAVLAGVLVSIAGLWSATSMEDLQISTDRVANECAGNGLYSFAYYAWTCRFDYDEYYLTMDQAEADDVVRRQVVGTRDQRIVDSPNPVDRIAVTGRQRRDYNVVLILEESFGSDFVGVLGDKRGLTANFDELTNEGLLFTNFFATGNRTARALEAVLTSMPPIPTESILKRDHSQRVYTLANVLETRGYERLFITAGRGLFDGVRSFMTANGFNRFIELSDYQDPVFTNAWGVSDEDLFTRGLEELDELQTTGRPFFATLLTVSNHRPYTYPAGRIPETGKSRENAVKYADWALGDFFRKAKSHAFYKNTIFVVLGDHGARVYGRQIFPIWSYRVPALMILPESEQRGTRNDTMACSLDIAPTILAALGGDYRSVFFGRDVRSTPKSSGRALMQHNHDVALLRSDGLMTVLGFRKSKWSYRFDKKSIDLKQQRDCDPEQLQQITAIFQTAFYLYYQDLWFPAR